VLTILCTSEALLSFDISTFRFHTAAPRPRALPKHTAWLRERKGTHPSKPLPARAFLARSDPPLRLSLAALNDWLPASPQSPTAAHDVRPLQ
jgi:hypothetical protein